MRILVISWEYPPYVVGGIGKHVAQLLPVLGGHLLDDGPLQIDVITPRYAGGEAQEQMHNGVTVYRIDMPAMDARDLYNSVIANNAYFVEEATRLAEQHCYQLIHIHDWLTGMAGIVLKHQWKVPLLVTMHATERGRHQGHIPSNTSRQIDEMDWRICYEAWQVIVCSQYMRSELQNFFKVPDDKIRVIVNGVSVGAEATCTPEDLNQLRRQYAPNGEKLLFFVGRVTYEKGLQVLIQAMPRILGDHPQTRLLVVGRNGVKMWPLAYELNVDQAIEFLGYATDHLRDCLYQIVDAAIFPSLYEPFGIVALEAMLLDCNVIVSEVGGLREVVKHKENGLTVYPNDPASIAWAVNQLFADPGAAQQRRQRALEDAHTIYRWEKVAAQTAQLYQEIVQARTQVAW
jgi:glycosyltransferase involved in cell wall biosynthesis